MARADAVASFGRLRAPDVASGSVNVVLGFAAAVWRGVAPAEQAPADLADLREIAASDGRGAPAT